jgi:hypothetical protein
MPRRLGSSLVTAEQRIELAGGVECREIIEATDMPPVDEDLGHGPPA